MIYGEAATVNASCDEGVVPAQGETIRQRVTLLVYVRPVLAVPTIEAMLLSLRRGC